MALNVNTTFAVLPQLEKLAKLDKSDFVEFGCYELSWNEKEIFCFKTWLLCEISEVSMPER